MNEMTGSSGGAVGRLEEVGVDSWKHDGATFLGQPERQAVVVARLDEVEEQVGSPRPVVGLLVGRQRVEHQLGIVGPDHDCLLVRVRSAQPLTCAVTSEHSSSDAHQSYAGSMLSMSRIQASATASVKRRTGRR